MLCFSERLAFVFLNTRKFTQPKPASFSFGRMFLLHMFLLHTLSRDSGVSFSEGNSQPSFGTSASQSCRRQCSFTDRVVRLRRINHAPINTPLDDPRTQQERNPSAL